MSTHHSPSFKDESVALGPDLLGPTVSHHSEIVPPRLAEGAEDQLSRHESVAHSDGHPDLGPPPDGGRDAWLVVFAAMLLLFSVYGVMNAAGQLQAYWLENQLKGYSRGNVAWQGSVQSMIEFSLALFTGRWFDLHGARALTVGGTILGTAALVGMAFSYEFYQLLLANLLFGIAGSAVFAPANAVVAHWFLRWRGTALAIVVGGAGLGGVIYPIMIENLLQRMSYRNTMLVIAFMNLGLMIPSCIFMKARLPPRRPPPWSYLKRPWHQPRYVFLVVGASFYMTNIFSPFMHGVVYANSNNVPSKVADYAIAIMGAGSVVGRLVAGVLADHIGIWKVFGSVGPLTTIVMFAFWVPTNLGLGPTIVGLLFYGALSGSYFALMGGAVASISPLEEVGMRIGLLITVFSVPTLVGPFICGELIAVAHDKWTYAGIFMGLCAFLSAVLVIAPLLWQFVTRLCHRKDSSAGKNCPTATQPATPAVCDDKARTLGDDLATTDSVLNKETPRKPSCEQSPV